LYGDNNEKYSIHATDGCYDPLSYPLFFPRGSLVGIQISLSTMSLGRLHNNQEETVITIQVRLVGMLICQK
uniref:Uncharacterized protein n=1 Tax=Aegilops tauschii subsp. strangulata TaxID=200361 RepID=A0A452ZER7_AEGTS